MAGENFPVTLLVHLTVPVGEEPLTVAVSFTEEPTTTADVELVTVVGEGDELVATEVVEVEDVVGPVG